MLELIVQENASDIQRVLGALQAEFSALKINGAEDKEGMKAAKEAFKKVRGFRIDWETAGEGLVKKVNEAKKKFQGELATEIAKFKELEASITAEIKRVEKEAEDARLEAEAAAEKRFVDRTTRMFQVGFTYNGHLYVIGAIAYNPQQIDEMEDSLFESMLVKGSEEAENVKAFMAYAAKQKEELEKANKESIRLLSEKSKPIDETQQSEWSVNPPDGLANVPFDDDFSYDEYVKGGGETVVIEKSHQHGPIYPPGEMNDLPFDDYLEKKSETGIVETRVVTGVGNPDLFLASHEGFKKQGDPANTLPPGYTMGFDACRSKVLNMLNTAIEDSSGSGETPEFYSALFDEIAALEY